jgi:hypothetical protein
MSNKRKAFCINITRKLLEEFLFQNKVRLKHIEVDPRTEIIKLYIEGAGPNCSEGCRPVVLADLEDALKAIKEAITECPQNQND